MRSNLLLGSTLALAGTVVLWSCGGGGSTPAPTAPTAGTATITIVTSSGNRAFTPDPIQVSSGSMIVWKNSTGDLHHIILDDGSIVGDIAPGASSGLQLRSAGAQNYHCTIHSTMIGSINGATVPEPPPCTTPGYC